MALVKVRHAVVRYRGTYRGQDTVLAAFRGETVDVPDEDLKQMRLDGAVVNAEAELPRLGQIAALPIAATDEEILNWVAAATKDEIMQLVADRPMLAERIRAAQVEVEADFKRNKAVRGEVEKAVNAGVELHNERNPDTGVDEPVVLAPTDQSAPAANERPASGDDVELSDDPDDIITGNVSEVRDFLADNPDMANDIEQAERRQAETLGRDPRVGVLEACENARKFFSKD